jgi:hypothetical protein
MGKSESVLGLRLPQGLDAPFLYGSHYSCPGYVMFWMVRAAPAHLLRCAPRSLEHAAAAHMRPGLT